jgi:hypothetical protein
MGNIKDVGHARRHDVIPRRNKAFIMISIFFDVFI